MGRSDDWSALPPTNGFQLKGCYNHRYHVKGSKMLTSLIIAVLLQPESAGLPDPVELTAVESWPVRHPTHHIQGLCVDRDHFWISSVERKAKKGWVYLVDRHTLTVTKEREISIGEQYHPGGMQVVGGELWVPVAEYKPTSTSTMLCLDAMSLETLRSFPLLDHIGGVAVSDDGTIYAANWDCKTLYELDADGKILGRKPNPTGVAYQDLKWHQGKLWGTGSVGILKLNTGIVDVIDPDQWALKQRYRLAGKTADGGSNFGREGLAIFEDSLYLLPEDGPHTTVHRFPLPSE